MLVSWSCLKKMMNLRLNLASVIDNIIESQAPHIWGVYINCLTGSQFSRCSYFLCFVCRMEIILYSPCLYASIRTPCNGWSRTLSALPIQVWHSKSISICICYNLSPFNVSVRATRWWEWDLVQSLLWNCFKLILFNRLMHWFWLSGFAFDPPFMNYLLLICRLKWHIGLVLFRKLNFLMIKSGFRRVSCGEVGWFFIHRL